MRLEHLEKTETAIVNAIPEGQKRFGFFLNGDKLIRSVVAKDIVIAKKKLDFLYKVNHNIQIREI